MPSSPSPASSPSPLLRPLAVPLLWGAALLLSACGGGGGGDGAGAGAAAQVIGLDSSVAPSVNMRCVDGPPLQDGVNQLPNLLFPFFGVGATCTLLTFSAQDPGNAGPGTVTTARIRVGNISGPMRFVRLRNFYQNVLGTRDSATCCGIQEYGPVFTPTPNSVTTVTLNFRMTWEPRPPVIDLSTIIAQDRIGLEVLDPNTPIPGVWTRNGLPEIGVNATFIWLPSISQQGFPPAALQLPNRTTSFSGFVPTFNYTFVPG